MQRLVIDVEDRYLDLIMGLLLNFKQNIVRNVTIEQNQLKNNISKLEKFRELKSKSNNKTILTMDMATNTHEMINDGLL